MENINARQGRCSYYITPCGFNLIEVLYRDLILKEELEYNVAEKVQLETFVSKYIVKKYIKDEDYKNKVLELWKKRVNPLEYKKDNGLLRFLMLLKIRYYYYEAYKEANWDWD